MNQVITKEIAKRIEGIETDSIYSRLSRIEKIKDNPVGVKIRKFGNATAFTVQNIPGPAFNKIKGMMDEDLPFLDEIIDFYHQKGISVRFELTPAHATSTLFLALSQKGYVHTDFLTNLHADPKGLSGNKKQNPAISIREFEHNEFDLFAELYIDAFDMPAFLKKSIVYNNKVLHGMSEWKFYLASFGTEPAGFGVLFM